MPDYHKLLLNLEESIFHLVQKRDYQITIEFPKDKHMSPLRKYDKEYILTNLNIDLNLSNQIVDVYVEKHKNIINIDIDILNLIVKYVSICGKILNQELIDLLGVRELHYTPSNTIKNISHDYIINKYNRKIGWGITDSMVANMRYIFLNIVLPFSEKHMLNIYKL
jgi:hypothetical protein